MQARRGKCGSPLFGQNVDVPGMYSIIWPRFELLEGPIVPLMLSLALWVGLCCCDVELEEGGAGCSCRVQCGCSLQYELKQRWLGAVRILVCRASGGGGAALHSEGYQDTRVHMCCFN